MNFITYFLSLTISYFSCTPGLIEGYSSERDQLDHKIEDLEEQKENLVLELETVNNKLRDMDTMQEENTALKKEISDQQELMSSNVGEEAQGCYGYKYALISLGVAIGCYVLHEWLSAM